MDVTVCVATFGDPHWIELAIKRAMPSAQGQAHTIHRHGRTLAEARNAALEQIRSEWVIFLDADDELEPGYVKAMAAGTADLRAPSVAYVRRGHRREPHVPKVAGHTHDCDADCLIDGNWLVVGSCVRTDVLRCAGGWKEEAIYEDWSAWLRCYLAGASVEAVPAAVYRAHVRADSRNRAPSMVEKNRIHAEIVAANFPRMETA